MLANVVTNEKSPACRCPLLWFLRELRKKAFQHSPYIFKVAAMKVFLRNSFKPVLFRRLPCNPGCSAATATATATATANATATATATSTSFSKRICQAV